MYYTKIIIQILSRRDFWCGFIGNCKMGLVLIHCNFVMNNILNEIITKPKFKLNSESHKQCIWEIEIRVVV